MIKYYYLLCLALKNLFTHKSKALMVAVPLAIIIAIVSAFSFFIEGVKHDALLAVHYSPDILLQQQVGGRTESMFFNRYDDMLQKLDGIKSYFPRTWGYINHLDKDGHSKAFVVMGLDPTYIQSGLLIDAAMESGRSLNQDDQNKGLIGKAMAAAFNCRLGDTIEVDSPNLRKKIPIEVVGIFDSAVQIYTADLLLVNRATANEILGYLDEDECSDIVIYLANANMANVLAQQMVRQIEAARPLTKAVMISLTEQSFGQKSGFFHLLWFILLVNIMIIAWSLLGQISFNLKKEIGILKAIGWDTGDIMVLKSLETFLIATFGVISGLVAGIAYMILDAPGIKGLIIGWADIYPDFPIPLYIEMSTIFLIAILGIVPLMAGTLLPVWKIGTIDPDEAIRL